MKTLIFTLFLVCSVLAQEVNKQSIREILILQENYNEADVEYLWSKYVALQKYNSDNLWQAIGMGAISGVALGAHESYTFNYKQTTWLPGFMKDWYEYRPQSDMILGKTFTWQKVFRDLDYSFDRVAYEKWKIFYGCDKFFSFETIYAYLSHWILKNTFATIIRDKFKHNKFFYSFKLELLIP